MTKLIIVEKILKIVNYDKKIKELNLEKEKLEISNGHWLKR